MKEFEPLKGKKHKAFDDLPANYFSQLKAEVMKQVDISENTTLIMRLKKHIPAMAASLLLLLGIGLLILFNTGPSEQKWQANNDNYITGQPDTGSKANKGISGEHTTEQSPADSLKWENISTEEIISYLLRYEEFEF